MKKKSISELIHFFVRHPLQNSLQMKFWRWLVSPADAEDKEEAIQEEWMNIIAEPDEATRRSWYEVRRKAGLANPIIKPHWEIKPLLRIASMILIPLFSVLLSWYYINDYTDSCKLVEYIVPMGERGELTLPDGTKVQINSESSIIYPKSFRGDTRTVYLSEYACILNFVPKARTDNKDVLKMEKCKSITCWHQTAVLFLLPVNNLNTIT